jgi:hypothetical protein
MLVKSIIFILSACLALPPLTSYAGDAIAVVNPSMGKLAATRIDLKLLVAEFRGQTEISGKLVAQWIVDDEIADSLQIHLLPDERSIHKLPHLGRYDVNYISLENGIEALRSAVGKVKSSQIEQKQIDYLSVTGIFLIDRYSVGIECDEAWANARIIKSRVLAPLNLAAINQRYGC